MKKDGKYCYTLQFRADSEERVQAGELLERLGNKKSAVVVAALNEYLASHPELQRNDCRIEVVSSGYSPKKVEQLIRRIVEEKIAELHFSAERRRDPSETVLQEPPMEISEVKEDDIAQMLENLELFQ